MWFCTFTAHKMGGDAAVKMNVNESGWAWKNFTWIEEIHRRETRKQTTAEFQ
eukprot:NODE_6216_length_368_cov_49.175549_g5496_i0.p2 GENE.NODE_6216_length_368_cov_49.175549_g5496_i0~~NODE_6216_length_368_cov_49.175549_g5496_i0.p2  ORF type:complete len:52 (+),score=5.78 NODE_6216_length_368_cov_49.175549_g5496_i0:135-290(+)